MLLVLMVMVVLEVFVVGMGHCTGAGLPPHPFCSLLRLSAIVLPVVSYTADIFPILSWKQSAIRVTNSIGRVFIYKNK